MGAAASCVSGTGNGRQLLAAAATGNAEQVRTILDGRPELASYTFFAAQYNCIHHAAAKGHTLVIMAVLDTLQSTHRDPTVLAGKPMLDGVDPKEDGISAASWGRLTKDVLNARNSLGQTPLMLACDNGHHRAVQLLLRSGADFFVVDRTTRRSAIHYAANGGAVRVLKVLLSDETCIHTEEGMQPLKYVRVQDMSGQCRYIDSRAENGMTALHLAAVMGHLDCVQSLLDAGASMMVRTVDLEMSSTVSVPAGSTPLHLAAQQGNVAIVQAMLQAHSDAMGTWGRGGDDGPGSRRPWEGDGRIDLRSVANVLRQLPYHVAWVRGYREAAGILNPTVAIDTALENVRDMQDGFGPQKLAVLAAYALRQNLLVWLADYKHHWDEAVRSRRVIAEQQRKRFAQAEMAHRTLTMPKVLAEDKGHMMLALNADSDGQSLPAGPGLALPNAGGQRISDGPQRLGSSFSRMSPLNESHPHSPSSPEAVGAAAAAPSHIVGTVGRPSHDLPNGRPAAPMSAFQQASGISAAPGVGTAEIVGGQSVEPPSGLPVGPSISPFALYNAPSLDAAFLPSASSPPDEGGMASNPSWEPMRSRKKSVSFAGEAPAPSQHSRPPHARSRSFNAYSPHHQNAGDMGLLSTINSTANSRTASTEVAAINGLTFMRTPSQHLGLPGDADAAVAVELSEGSQRRQSLGAVLSKSLRRRTSLGGNRRAPSRTPSNDLWRAASIQGFEDDGLEECGICLSRPHEVCIGICHHMLCNECAISLCEAHKKPPMCPFCRRMIASFAPKPMGVQRRNMSFRLSTN